MLTCHCGCSSYGVSLPQTDRAHWPCLMLAQCWNDRITGFFKVTVWGPTRIIGPNTVWVSTKITLFFRNKWYFEKDFTTICTLGMSGSHYIH